MLVDLMTEDQIARELAPNGDDEILQRLAGWVSWRFRDALRDERYVVFTGEAEFLPDFDGVRSVNDIVELNDPKLRFIYFEQDVESSTDYRYWFIVEDVARGERLLTVYRNSDLKEIVTGFGRRLADAILTRDAAVQSAKELGVMVQQLFNVTGRTSS